LSFTNSLYNKQSGKYFKLATDSGLEKTATSHNFVMITEHNITYTTVNFPELVGANLLNIQHCMQG
jgi:hypothetical protein